MDLRAGDVIDQKYEVTRLLGRGGMGSVYEGRHRRIHRRVAIKVLHSVIATNQAVVQRFEREAQAAGRIGSEHIVEVLDIGELPSGERYMVMEFLEGRSLGARLAQDGQLLPEHAFPVMAELLEGLAAAHEAGIVHRDLKPDNIWLARSSTGRGEFVKILDFGVSKFRTGERDVEVTQTGIVVGTPSYMAPEQARADRDIDERADLFAVGVILYRCLAGRLPHEGATYNELMFKVVLEDPPPLETVVPGLDPEVVRIVHRALSRERNERFQSAKFFKNALVNWLQRHGYPVSLAVVDLLQSGDRVGAELLQSGDGWNDDPVFDTPGGLDAPTRRDRGSEPEGLRDDLLDLDGTRTARQTPLAKRTDDSPGETSAQESTALLPAKLAAALHEAERSAEEPAGSSNDARAVDPTTVARPASPLAFGIEATRMTSALSTPAPGTPPRAVGATIAVGVAALVVLVALLVGIGAAAGEEHEMPRAGAHWGPEVQRIAASAGQFASEAEEGRRGRPNAELEPPGASEPGNESDARSTNTPLAPRPHFVPRPKQGKSDPGPKKPDPSEKPDPNDGGRTFRREL